MELASLIEDLGKACGLELTLDEGRCTLRFDGEHDVTIERDGNAVHPATGSQGTGAACPIPTISASCSLPRSSGPRRTAARSPSGNAPGKSCSGSGLTPSRTIRTSKPAINAFLAQLIHWKGASTPCRPWRCPLRPHSPPAGSWFKAILGKGGRTFLEPPTFSSLVKNFSVFQHESGVPNKPQGQSFRAPGREKGLEFLQTFLRVGGGAAGVRPPELSILALPIAVVGQQFHAAISAPCTASSRSMAKAASARRDRRSVRGSAAFGSGPFCPCGTARAGCPESAGCPRP